MSKETQFKFLSDRPRMSRLSRILTILNWVIPIVILLVGIQISTQIFAENTKYKVANKWYYNTKLVGDPYCHFKFFKKQVYLFNPLFYLANVFKNPIRSSIVAEDVALARITAESTSVALCCAASSLILAFLMRLVRMGLNRGVGNIHGNAKWMSEEDLKACGLMSNDDLIDGLKKGKEVGIVCGQLNTAKIKVDRSQKTLKFIVKKGKKSQAPLICHKGTEANTLLLAPTRTGKGVGVIFPTLFAWRGSIVCFDPKGESFSLSAGFRSAFSRVIKFAPLDMDSMGFNPILAIKDDLKAIDDAQTIASIFFPSNTNSESSDNSDFFNQSAADVLTTMILHVRFSERSLEKKSLAEIFHLLSAIDPSKGGGGQGEENFYKELFKGMLEEEHFLLDELGQKDTTSIAAMAVIREIEEGLKRQIGKPSKEMGSIVATVFSKMRLFGSPTIARATSRSDFEIEDFVKSDCPVSLYLVVPESDIGKIAPIFNFIIEFMLKRLLSGTTQFGDEKLKNRCLFILDEFKSLGKMPLVAEAMGISLGYGLSFLIVAQGLNQLVDTYGDKHPFCTHCTTKIIYSPCDIKDAQAFCEYLGKETIEYSKTSQNLNSGSIDVGEGLSTQDSGRDLMTPDQFVKMDLSLALIMETGQNPYLAKKVVYYADTRFTRQLDYAKKHPLKSRMQKINEKTEKQFDEFFAKFKRSDEYLKYSRLTQIEQEDFVKAKKIEIKKQLEEDKTIKDDLLSECYYLPSNVEKRKSKEREELRDKKLLEEAEVLQVDDPFLIDQMFEEYDEEDDLFDQWEQAQYGKAFREDEGNIDKKIEEDEGEFGDESA